MSEQDQTETKSGGGVAGVVAGSAAGAATYLRYAKPKAENKLIEAALDGSLGKDQTGEALEKSKKVATAVHEGLHATSAETKTNLITAKLAKTPENISSIEKVTFTEIPEGKGFKAVFTGQAGKTSTLTGIKALPKDVKLENGAVTLEGDAVKKLTEGAEKSWVAKTAKTAEKAAIKEIRGGEAFKAAGGAMKHANFGGKLSIIAVPVVATVAVGAIAKSVFAGKHTSQVEADRSTMPEQGAARA